MAIYFLDTNTGWAASDDGDLYFTTNGGVPVTSVSTTERNKIHVSNYLLQNYPNPFNPSTTINYNIPAEGHVEISVFNILGQKVRELVNEFKHAGSFTVKFEAGDLSSGVYFYILRTGGFVETKKLIIQK